jgi:hypothetical protein
LVRFQETTVTQIDQVQQMVDLVAPQATTELREIAVE